MKKTKILALCECAVMLSLSIVLSLITVWKMPMGGGVTLFSMLPVMLMGLRHGFKGGLMTSLAFAAFQLIQGITSGEVFVWCTTWVTVLVVAAFDYLVPYTVLGLSALASRGDKGVTRLSMNAVLASLITIRFICHFITGVTVWGQWAPEGMGKYLYSLVYNGQYMLPELIITLIGANLIFSVPYMRSMMKKK